MPQWGTNPVDTFLAEFISVLDAALGYLEPAIFGLYDTLMVLGIAALSVFLLRGGREYFDRLGPRVLYLGAMGFILENFETITGAIASTFVFLGITAGGGQMAEYTFWHPGLLSGYGWEAAAPLRKAASEASILEAGGLDLIFWYGLAAFLLKFSFDVMAVAVLVSIIGFKLGSVAAFILAATAALPRFAWMAAGAFGFVISAGVGLFSYALIISVVTAVTQQIFTNSTIGDDLKISVAITTAVINFGLVILGPSMIRGVMSGVANMGLGAAATAVGSAALTFAAPVAGGAALARGSTRLATTAIGAMRGTATAGTGAIGQLAQTASRGSAGAIGKMAQSTASAAGNTPAISQRPAWAIPKQLPSPSLRGISSVHAMRALVPDGTDQGGGMMAPTNPERN